MGHLSMSEAMTAAPDVYFRCRHILHLLQICLNGLLIGSDDKRVSIHHLHSGIKKIKYYYGEVETVWKKMQQGKCMY